MLQAKRTMPSGVRVNTRLLLASLLVAVQLMQVGLAASNTEADQLDRHLTNVLRAEIKLARFNLHYRMEAAKQGRWKGLRYFLSQESNAALSEAGLIVGVTERMGHITGKRYRLLNQRTLETGNVLGGIGQAIGGSASAIEYGINTYHSIRAAHGGFSPDRAIKHANELVAAIDQELAYMNDLCSGDTSMDEKVAQAQMLEITVLRDIRNLLVSEFAGFHIKARRTLWTQQSFYLIDIAKNAVGAVGNVYGYKALHEHNRKYNRPAGILVTISGALTMGAPILSRLAGRAIAYCDRKRLRKSGLDDLNTGAEKLEADLSAFRGALKDISPAFEEHDEFLERLGVAESHTHRFLKQLETGEKEERQGNRIAIQNVLSGLFVGGTKVANGIEFTEAGFRYNNSSRMTNVLIGTGSIPYLAGSAYALADNLRIQVRKEIDRRRLSSKNELPRQLIQQQLAELDKLEASLDPN
jgi:hypothetical protein